MKQKTDNVDSTSLFDVADGSLVKGIAQTDESATVMLISSPLVEETKDWLSTRQLTLGNMLASDRAAEYVACLRALAAFRDEHEPEPLHEDVELKVCGEEATHIDLAQFKNDIRQLKEWRLVTERIEKERLRGYRDNRRTKFRYRICDDAVAFVEWLSMRRVQDFTPTGADETGNLLDMQRSLVAELCRMINRIDTTNNIDYETASDVFFRIDQIARNIDATARTLQELNLRLLGFAIAEFSVDEAKTVVEELSIFLERFGRRFGLLREDILSDIEKLRRERYVKRWSACAEVLKAEALRFRHITSVKVPDSDRILADASFFYSSEGRLVSLMSRVVDSARKVWGKLNAKLRELERRNHRIEDLGLRLQELALLKEDDVPHKWMCRLIEQANMRGDHQARARGEKLRPPMPKRSSRVKTEKIVSWITPRNVGERPDVLSISQKKAQMLQEWMKARGIFPSEGITVSLGLGKYSDFKDFSNLMQMLEYVWLGEGERAKKLLSVEGNCVGNIATVKIDEANLLFEDVNLTSWNADNK